MMCALLVLGIRVLEDGLKPRLEAAHYRRYAGELAEIERVYVEAPTAERFALMRNVEELSYRELRDFLMNVKSASFVI